MDWKRPRNRSVDQKKFNMLTDPHKPLAHCLACGALLVHMVRCLPIPTSQAVRHGSLFQRVATEQVRLPTWTRPGPPEVGPEPPLNEPLQSIPHLAGSWTGTACVDQRVSMLADRDEAKQPC
jgi:hypothetical protein